MMNNCSGSTNGNHDDDDHRNGHKQSVETSGGEDEIICVHQPYTATGSSTISNKSKSVVSAIDGGNVSSVSHIEATRTNPSEQNNTSPCPTIGSKIDDSQIDSPYEEPNLINSLGTSFIFQQSKQNPIEQQSSHSLNNSFEVTNQNESIFESETNTSTFDNETDLPLSIKESGHLVQSTYNMTQCNVNNMINGLCSIEDDNNDRLHNETIETGPKLSLDGNNNNGLLDVKCESSSDNLSTTINGQSLAQSLQSQAQYRQSLEYLKQLFVDRERLQLVPFGVFKHLSRLLEQEIQRIRTSLIHIDGAADQRTQLMLPEPEGPIVSKSTKIYVPTEKYPDLNFIGRIIGPRGLTIRELEVDCGCKLYIRGRGSLRDKNKEEKLRSQASWEHLNDGLHVLIMVDDTENRAKLKLDRAITEINKLLDSVITNKDEFKMRQLAELAILNDNFKAPSSSSSSNQNVIAQDPNSIAAAAAVAASSISHLTDHHKQAAAAAVAAQLAVAQQQHQLHHQNSLHRNQHGHQVSGNTAINAYHQAAAAAVVAASNAANHHLHPHQIHNPFQQLFNSPNATAFAPTTRLDSSGLFFTPSGVESGSAAAALAAAIQYPAPSLTSSVATMNNLNRYHPYGKKN